MTRSFEIRDSETLFEAAKALEEAIEGDESDTSVGDDASEIVFTGRPESIPVEATPVQSNPVPPVDKPALPTHGASGADVQIYIISVWRHDYGACLYDAQSVASKWRHGRGSMFRDTKPADFERIFGETDGKVLFKSMTEDKKEEQRNKDQQALGAWKKGGGPLIYKCKNTELATDLLI